MSVYLGYRQGDADTPFGNSLPATARPVLTALSQTFNLWLRDSLTDQPVQITRVNCAAKAGLYVQEGLYTGDLRFSHFVMTSDKLDLTEARRILDRDHHDLDKV